LKYRHKLLALASIPWLAACATEQRSVGTGAAIGAVGGAAIGGIADPGKDGEFRTRNVLVGATLGTMVGAVSSALIHKKMEEAKKEAYLKGKAAPTPTGQPPKLSEPKVEAKWVEGRAQGNRWIDGHWEYQIIEPARWTEGE
jgi:hypothetical protein